MMPIQCAVVGRVTKDPVLRTARSGREWLSVSVKIGDGEDATFATIAYFGDAADKFAGLISEGTWVYAKGRAALRTWDWQGRQYHGLNISGDYLVVLDDFTPPQPKAKKAERDPDLWDDKGRHEVPKNKKRAGNTAGGAEAEAEPFNDSLDDL